MNRPPFNGGVSGVRLGIYMDLDYTTEGATAFTDEAVIRFVAGGMAKRVKGLTLFGRLAPGPAQGPYEVPSDVDFVPLPHYESVTDVLAVAGAARRSCAIFAEALSRLDAVWLFGPHPLSLTFAAIAHRHGKPVFLGIRQDFPRYIAGRLPSPLWSWAVPAAWFAECAYRLLARRLPTVVIGQELARKYGSRRDTVLAAGISLVRDEDIVTLDEARGKSWEGELWLLSVGRLGPEKNPTLLPEILALLRKTDTRWRLAIAGSGPMEQPVRQRAAELGVEHAVELLGYVPNGAALRHEYRRSHAFLHVSFTEGLPQVIFEAQAAGVPIVATDVGGVADALEGGRTGLLVPPADAPAAVGALQRLRDDEPLRDGLVARGLTRARAQTMDIQLDRITEFFEGHLYPSVPRRAGGTSVVLLYHDVVPHRQLDTSGFPGMLAGRYKLEPAQFEAHLDAVADTGAEVGLISTQGTPPPVAITFDDGGSSSIAIAEAIERRGWLGHFFVITGLLGEPGFLDADEVRELVRRGHLVGSHSHFHPDYMSRLPQSEIELEWMRSREVLGDLLGAPPTHASVPGGDVSPAVTRAAINAGYGVLMTSEPRHRFERIGPMLVCGRYALGASSSPRTAAAYVLGRGHARARLKLQWKAKRFTKSFSPRAYERARTIRARVADRGTRASAPPG